MNTRETAREYVGYGWAIVPLPPRQKGPRIPDWPNKTFSPEDFAPADNIGVKTGAPSGGLVDVDLDHPLAVEFARDFLPATGRMFGHGTRPESHRLYLCGATAGKTRRWQTASGETIIELRGTGGQTMFPPSIHPCGESVAWAAKDQPLDVDWDRLVEDCEALAQAVRQATGETMPPNPTVSTGGRDPLLRRAAAYADAAKPSVQGGRNAAAFNLAGNLAAFTDGPDRLSEAEIVDLLRSRWNTRNTPPLDESELAACAASAMKNGTPRPDHPARQADCPAIIRPSFLWADELISRFPDQPEPIIEGLLRRGDVGNLVSGPKAHKSWTLLNAALCIGDGRPWLGFPTRPGRVLLLDYELSPGTLTRRLQAVALAMGLTLEATRRFIAVEPLRGRRLDLGQLGRYFAGLSPRQFDCVIIDPLYKAFPRELNGRAFDENSNANLADVYAQLTDYAERLDAAIVVVHHLTKGDQSGKAVTDLGAGGGSQARAADAHLAIRPHTQDGAAVLSGVVRSFEPFTPRAIRWDFPIWKLAPDLDPADLRRPPRRNAKRKDTEAKPAEEEPPYGPEQFVSDFLTAEPRPAVVIIEEAKAKVRAARRAKTLLELAEAKGLAHRWTISNTGKIGYANRKEPALLLAEPAEQEKGSRAHTRTPHTPRGTQKRPRGGGRRARARATQAAGPT